MYPVTYKTEDPVGWAGTAARVTHRQPQQSREAQGELTGQRAKGCTLMHPTAGEKKKEAMDPEELN